MKSLSGWGGSIDRRVIDEFWEGLDQQTAVTIISTDYAPHGGPLNVIVKPLEVETREVREDLTRDLFLRAAMGGQDTKGASESVRFSSMARAIAVHYDVNVIEMGSKDERIGSLV
jgi:hypothetical protein